MKIISNYKEIIDLVHGTIKLSDIATKIIDTPYFQRLRYIKQLGVCYLVYPNAIHTRFEHSIGTYYLAGRLLNSIKKNSDNISLSHDLVIPELDNYYMRTYRDRVHIKLDDYVCELIKIAALCHDIGHGPFSHMFDDIFINNYKKIHSKHEVRSGLILEYIINSDEHLSNIIKDPEITFMKNLIDPQKHHTSFIYQIVSNIVTQIDVDKLDYISRDIKMLGLNIKFDPYKFVDDIKVFNNFICYPEDMKDNIIELFKIRYRLNKQIYSDKIVTVFKHMMKDIMINMDPILNIHESIKNFDHFIKMTDNYVISCLLYINSSKLIIKELLSPNISRAYTLWDNINNRKIYKFINTIYTHEQLSPTIDRRLELAHIKSDNIIIDISRVSFFGNIKYNINPKDNIYLFDNKDRIKKAEFDDSLDTNEYIYTIISKNNHDHHTNDKIFDLTDKIQ
jgi:HD superfamily phosphohydrolase